MSIARDGIIIGASIGSSVVPFGPRLLARGLQEEDKRVLGKNRVRIKDFDIEVMKYIELGRFLGAGELWVRTGDPSLAVLYYLGVGTAESLMAFRRIMPNPFK